uniref:O-acyltransferase WSD1 C-terminal domain-containing protein n=1 Tax=Oryza barthii TaxID=65489 RepID=A0A0D3EUH9_9ORYZ
MNAAGADTDTVLRKRQLTVRTTSSNGGNGFRVGGGKGAAAATPPEPVSPSARLLEDFFIVVVIGIATPVNDPVARAGIAAQFARYPRFRSIQVTDEDGGNPRWVRTTLNVDDHIIYPELDMDAVAADPDKAVEDYVASLSTRTGARPRPPASAGALAFAAWLWSFVALAWHTVVDVASFFATTMFLKDPHTLFKRVKHGEFQRKRIDPHTLFKRVKHGEFQQKRIVHRGLSLDDVKLVKNAMNCTVNDVLVGITYSALSRYYYRKSGDKDTDEDIRLRSILLVNLRPTTSLHAYVDMINSGREDEVKWGNALGFIILPFFIGVHKDPLDYVRKAKKVVDRKKSSLEVVFTHLAAEVILKLFGLKAAAAIFHRMISHTTISFSNMIGPVEQVEFCGHPVVFIAPSGYGPPEALTVNFQSYVNTMMVNLAVDEAQFPDCHELLDDFSESLRQIKDAALSLGKHHTKA